MRLAADCVISKSAITRVLSGRSKPTFRIVCRITDAFERDFGQKFDVRDIFSETGEYPCTFCCRLVNCSGCLPKAACLRDDGTKDPRFQDVQRGMWTGDVHEIDGPLYQPILEAE
jgi:hypothetical protein